MGQTLSLEVFGQILEEILRALLEARNRIVMLDDEINITIETSRLADILLNSSRYIDVVN